jgi:hypothetical protein
LEELRRELDTLLSSLPTSATRAWCLKQQFGVAAISPFEFAHLRDRVLLSEFQVSIVDRVSNFICLLLLLLLRIFCSSF